MPDGQLAEKRMSPVYVCIPESYSTITQYGSNGIPVHMSLILMCTQCDYTLSLLFQYHQSMHDLTHIEVDFRNLLKVYMCTNSTDDNSIIIFTHMYTNTHTHTC